MTTPDPRLRALLERLISDEIRFVLIGGLAVGSWGYVRGTKDIDIVPDPSPENLSRLEKTALDLDGRVRVEEGLLAPNAISIFLRTGDRTLIATRLGDLDVLQGQPTVPGFEALAARAKVADVGGVRALVCSLEDLREMKRAADRPMDRIDLENLEIAHPEDTDA